MKGTTKTVDKPPRDEETNCTVAAVFNAKSNTTCDHEAAEKCEACSFEESCGTAKRVNLKRTMNNEFTFMPPYAADKDNRATKRYHREKE